MFSGPKVAWSAKSCRSLHAYALPKGIGQNVGMLSWRVVAYCSAGKRRLEPVQSVLEKVLVTFAVLALGHASLLRKRTKPDSVFDTPTGPKTICIWPGGDDIVPLHSLDPCFFPKTNSQEPKGAWRKPSGQAISELARA